MAPLISDFLVLLAVLLAIPVVILLLEVIAALALSAPDILFHSKDNIRKDVAVLIPAHNEANGIRSTLAEIKAQLLVGDRLIVIADNCTDNTAVIAASAGAEVVKRDEPAKMGKGYALDFGLKHLSESPPTTVVVIDADCQVANGTIGQLAMACTTTGRPTQALNLMTGPGDSSINYRVAEFAWRVKNWVRPLGLRALGMPCQLMGTGMAFPWNVICSAELASGSIVEDMKLGLDLTRIGFPIVFCPSARVTSHFPLSDIGAQSQRTRWEHGHLMMILTTWPKYIFEALAHGNFQLLALALDLAIPPLSFLAILLVAMFSVAGAAALFGISPTALIISATCIVALAVALFLSWLSYGRDILPPHAMFSIPSYIFSKLPIYHHLFSGRAASKWTRADRTDRK